MTKEFADRFNDNIERYRRALFEHAGKRDWENFKAKAGNLFDYVEVVEASEIERRFFRIFKSVLAALIAVLLAILNIDASLNPQFHRFRYSIMVLAAAGTCFELYAYMNFRSFMIGKTIYRKKRKDRFVRGIEKDFRDIVTARNDEQREKQAA